MEGEKKPQIRFHIFADEWRGSSIADVTEELLEYRTFSSGYPLLTSSRTGLMLQNEYRNNVTTESLETLFSVVPRGACTYRHMSDDDVFHFNINEITDNGLVSKEYPVFIAQNGFNLAFVVYLLNSSQQFRRFCREQKMGGTRTRLYYKSLTKYSSLFPSEEEQKNIATYIQQLDQLITDQQLKFGKLLSFKKSMLEKMFPKAGTHVPEVRFGGFSEEWSFLPFSKVFEEYSEKNHAELPALTIIQGFGTVKREESGRSIQYDESGLKNYKLVHEGDFIVHLRSFEGGLEKANSDGIVSPAYHLFHGENIDTGFYYAYFRSRRFVDVQLKPHVYGIRDGRSIDIEGMKTILIPCPSLPEQQKISQFLKNIDDLIANSQAELVKLKNIKKALLDKMFV